MGQDASELVVPFVGALQAAVSVLITIFCKSTGCRTDGLVAMGEEKRVFFSLIGDMRQVPSYHTEHALISDPRVW
jgi:hypothetical protein